MEHICVKKCFFRGRLWALGETLVPSPGEAVPKHFVKKADHKAVAAPNLKDPKVLAQIQKEEQAKALRAVGHAPQVPPAAPAAAPAAGKPEGPKNAEGQGVAGQQSAGAGAGSTDFLA